jgi:hypothetical protein
MRSSTQRVSTSALFLVGFAGCLALGSGACGGEEPREDQERDVQSLPVMVSVSKVKVIIDDSVVFDSSPWRTPPDLKVNIFTRELKGLWPFDPTCELIAWPGDSYEAVWATKQGEGRLSGCSKDFSPVALIDHPSVPLFVDISDIDDGSRGNMSADDVDSCKIKLTAADFAKPIQTSDFRRRYFLRVKPLEDGRCVNTDPARAFPFKGNLKYLELTLDERK